MVGYTGLRSLVSGGQRGRLRLVALRRAPRARRAAQEAALDDPAFAPEHIEAAVSKMLPRVLRNFGELAGRPHVDILGVGNRAGAGEDRVVVRVRARVKRNRPELAPIQVVHIDERWTLVHEGMQWRLTADMGDPLAASLLSSSLVATPGDDAARLHEASLEELTESHPRGAVSPGELADPAAPSPQRLRDLAVADDRFDPLLVHALDFPEAGAGRRRVRDAHRRKWEVTRLDADATPPQVDVRVRVKATASSDATIIATGQAPPTQRLDLVWTLELDEVARQHPRWRMIDSVDASDHA